MSCDSDTFWVVAAPSPNFDNIPNINVSTHEVPLPAYWQISDLLAQGKPKKEIVQSVMQHTGANAFKVITEVVDSVAENQRLMLNCSKLASRPHARSTTAKKISDYRAARIEARRKLRVAEERRDIARSNQGQLRRDAFILAQRRHELDQHPAKSCDHRAMTSTIERWAKQLMKQRSDVESEIIHAERLIVIHKSSLA
jgi:hypothetical protein